MAANMNEPETFFGVISFEEMSFSKSATENNSTNNSTFSEDEEKEVNIYDLQGNKLQDSKSMVFFPSHNYRIS